jgi:hypothetical protein
VIDAGELLLDHLGDGLLDRIRVGALIVRADYDLRRSDRRVGFDTQGIDREHAAERDQNRNDPGENRAVDEEI